MMTFGHCADCGHGLERNGVCPWCHEEAFIEQTQAEFMEGPYSPEWDRKVQEQVFAAAKNVRNRTGEMK